MSDSAPPIGIARRDPPVRPLRLIAAWGPVILFEAVVLYLSSRPNLLLPEVVPNIDKGAHLAEYAALGGLIYRALRLSGGSRRRMATLTIILASLLGAADEKLQAFVPGRVSSVSDWVADAVGASIGVFVVSRLESWLPMGWVRPGPAVPKRENAA